MPSNLFSAGQIGTMTLPNRVIRSATQDPFGHRDGTCAPEQVALYRDIAAAGTGAIITAYSYISPEARSTGIQVGFATEEQRASQKEVLDAVHEAGGRLILQLMHAGMNVFMPEKHVAGGKLLAPTGGLKAPNDMETTEITAEDMAKIKADFVDAAKAAKERLSAQPVPGPQHQPAHRCLRRQRREPLPLPRRMSHRHPRGGRPGLPRPHQGQHQLRRRVQGLLRRGHPLLLPSVRGPGCRRH